MALRPALLASGLMLALALGACARQTPQGAEAAAQAADQPKPVISAVTPQAAPIPSAQEFIRQAAAGDAFELAAARIAEQRAQNAAVKGFAAMMVHDHTDSAALLAKAVAESGQSLAPGGAPSADQQAQLAALGQTGPGGFDKAFMQGQIAAHQKALALMQGYAQNGGAPSLKAFAGQAASTVQQHLQLARSLTEQLP